MWVPLFKGLLLLALFTTASVIDIKRREIPDRINILIALTGFISFEPIKSAGIVIALPFLLTAMMCKGRMGGGDIKFMAGAGFVLGFEPAIIAAIIGLTTSLIYCAARYGMSRLKCCSHEKRPDMGFPLAPFLSIGCMSAFILQIGGFIL